MDFFMKLIFLFDIVFLSIGVTMFATSFVSANFVYQIVSSAAVIVVSSVNLGIWSYIYTNNIVSE